MLLFFKKSNMYYILSVKQKHSDCYSVAYSINADFFSSNVCMLHMQQLLYHFVYMSICWTSGCSVEGLSVVYR